MDRERLWWSVNGERGQMPQFKASSHDYKREDNLSGVEIEPINAILAQRLQAPCLSPSLTPYPLPFPFAARGQGGMRAAAPSPPLRRRAP